MPDPNAAPLSDPQVALLRGLSCREIARLPDLGDREAAVAILTTRLLATIESRDQRIKELEQAVAHADNLLGDRTSGRVGRYPQNPRTRFPMRGER